MPSEALQRLDAEADAVRDQLTTLRVATDADYQAAGEYLRDVTNALDMIETERKAITKPLNDALDSANAFFGKVATKYKAVGGHLRSEMGLFLDARKVAEREAMAKFAEGSGSGAELVLLAADAAPQAQGIQTRTKVTWAVSDLASVPDDYWCLDEKKIGAAVRGNIPVPGITVSRSTSLAVSRKV